MSRRPLLAAVLLALWTSACGDPLVDGQYVGDPLLSVSGPVLVPDSFALSGLGNDPTTSVRLGVFWATTPNDSAGTLAAVSGVEQAVRTTQASVLRYTVVLHAPPAAPLQRRPTLGTGKVALGQIIAYADLDRSGDWSPGPDQLLGGVEQIVVAYTPEGASGPMFARELTPGFHLLRASDSCHEDYALRPLEDLREDDDLRLVIRLSGAPDVYVDLNCDGTGHEWLPSSCPATQEELLALCGPDGVPTTPEGVPAGPSVMEFCTFCQDVGVFQGCEPQLEQCGEVWPDLCEVYQTCLDPAWEPSPHLQCDYEHIRCMDDVGPEGLPPIECEDAFIQCMMLADCEIVFRDCMASSGDEASCVEQRDACVEDNQLSAP